MKRFYLLRLVLPIMVLLGTHRSSIAQAVTNYTASGAYTYTVTGVSLAIDMAGAQGGSSGASAPGGKGGRVVCTLAVSPGQLLYVRVGGVGTNGNSSCAVKNGGFNGGGNGWGYGGGGGGMSEIRKTSGAFSSSNEYLVAAGGGGGGYNYANATEVGGYGGGLTGETGYQGNPGSPTPSLCGGGGTQTSGGSGATSYGTPAGSAGQGGSAVGSQCYSGGGGAGWYGGGTGAYGGGGGGSSYLGGSEVSSAVTTNGYQSGDGYVKITELCTPPGFIVGAAPVCVSETLTLSNPTGVGGVWVSSNTAVATINPTTGVLTGVSAGVTTITYLETTPCGGVNATATVSVNPLPGLITGGTANTCTGVVTALSNSAAGGTWTTSNSLIASVSSTGSLSALTVGTVTISYTLPTGCYRTTTKVVNETPYPYNITGGGNYCSGEPGVHVGISGSATGINYQLYYSGSSVSSTTGTGSSIDFGLYTTTGTYTGVATDISTGCTSNLTGSAVIGLNPNPAVPGGASNVCAGLTATVTDATPGGTWSTSSPSIATVNPGTGVVTGVTAGTATITYTLGSTGCKSTNIFQVFAQPSAIAGSSNVCVSGTTSLTNSGGGVWSSSSPGVATIGAGSGIVTGVTPGTTLITYTLSTGCNTTKSILVNPLPVAYAVTGGGSFCAGSSGANVGLSYSNSGVEYQLKLGGTAIGSVVNGSNSGLDFGPQTSTGTYTVSANNPLTGCSSNMTGSVAVNVNPLPVVHNVTGGGNVCIGGAGVSVGMDGTDPGVKYQLYNGITPVGGLVTGTGLPLTFGVYTTPGTYTVVASNPTTGCTNLMGNTAIISVNGLPTAYPVTGGGTYCAGGPGQHIMLANSDMGVNYQLMSGSTPIGGPVSSIGGLIDFGAITTTGTYTVLATDPLTTCSGNMLGSASVTISPLPVAYTVTGGGSYCDLGSGVHVGLGFSSTGVNYILRYYSINIDTVSGSGTSLDFGSILTPGTYDVVAYNTATGCENTMTGSVNVAVNPLPYPFNVTGGGNYCFGDAGVNIGTDNSDVGISYQLYKGTTAVGLPQMGTGGGAINFGLITAAGTYSVVARNTSTGCTVPLANTVTVGVNPLPGVRTVSGGGNYCAGGAGMDICLSGSTTGVNYELYYNGFVMGPAVVASGTGSSICFGPQTNAGIYTVWATDGTTGCMKKMTGSATININSLPIQFDVIGGGSYCSGSTGVHVGLSGSSSGISYQLYNGSAVGTPVSGSGGPIDFGVKTAAGSYTVVGRNLLTGCTNMMNSSATIEVKALPNDYVVSLGGDYCDGTAGIDVNIPSSDDLVEYQLYRGTTAVGAPQIGMSGMMVDFLFQTAGVYTVRATDPGTGCSKYMPGTSVINKIVPTMYSVTGGGGYCAGGTGVPVMLSGSQSGWTYELFIGGSPTAITMPGTGSALNFGLQTTNDVYTVVATNDALLCVSAMTGSATVITNPLPTANNVTGGGTYCAGGTGSGVGLDMGDEGVNYQLYNGTTAVGTAVGGTGTAVDFGLVTATGTYTVKATNATTGCTNDMNGSATITIKPLPARYLTSITGPNPLYPGYFCATDSGVHVYLPNSEVDVNYQLWRGTTAIGTPKAGTGSALDLGLQVVAGTYTVSAVQTTSTPLCASNMLGDVTVHIIDLPNVHNVTGGGNFCPGGTGVHVGLDGSEPGILYNLMNGSTIVGSLAATGAPLDFGLQTMLGTYTIEGTSQITYCPNAMLGNAVVKNDTIYTPSVTLRAFPGTGIDVWHVDSMHAYVTNGGSNPTYQWYVNGHEIPGATNASFTRYEFFNRDSVAVIVTASGPCGGNATKKSLTITLRASGVNVKNVSSVNSDVVLVPNPNKGTFTIKGTTTADEQMSVEVVNMIGQVVYHSIVSSNNGRIEEQIDLGSSVANGMYLLNLRSGTQNTVFHFVVEK